MDLVQTFGQIDIYLFDQLLRRRIVPGMRVLDAGCGFGRNLVYLLQSGYDVSACDGDADAMTEVRRMVAALAPHLPPDNFRTEPIEHLSFDPGRFDVVISSAVLHFARDEAQYDAMLAAMWRVLAPGGFLFARLASNIGIESRVRHLRDRLFALPDGTQRFLVDEEMLDRNMRNLGGDLLDPLKTTVVQDQRSMTTWVVRKR